eukprot:TRINITY_DN12974_c0_g1_i1.p1 TRINITY_DN12974_c0_g1~~TRINITY_DN12974_c0_g1_i1.p1  ORF type:complete len:194 (+),score=44.19 TRINITY_DN12974_c0_g1_i1:34-615(+)
MTSFLFLVASLPAINAWPKGAPTSVCQSMLPGHGKEPQHMADIPYHIEVPRFALKQNDKIMISLTSESERPFKGFVMKAVDVPGNNIIGTFSILETGANTTAQYLPCTHPQSSITHTNNKQKLLQTVEWTPPTEFAGPVVMVATFVKDGYTYWVNVTSDTIMVGSVEMGSGAASNSDMTRLASLFVLVLAFLQ